MDARLYTVEVTSLSPAATEKDVHDFFAFCGKIEHVEIIRFCQIFFPDYYFVIMTICDLTNILIQIDENYCHIPLIIVMDVKRKGKDQKNSTITMDFDKKKREVISASWAFSLKCDFQF